MEDKLKSRKDAHIDIVLDREVNAPKRAVGLGGWTLEYDALPEVDLEAVDLSTTVFGKRLRAPLVIGAMTGGTERTGAINRILARAAQRVGVAMALGSQRAMMEHPEVSDSFMVRESAPDLPLLFGNIGAIQLNYGMEALTICEALKKVGADALNFHLNPLQEAIQPEGDTRFSGLYAALQRVVPEISVPCLVKEVGTGLSERTARKLATLPLAGVEIAGVGGTSWAAVESHRAESVGRAEIGRSLAGFGIPTAESLRIARSFFPNQLVIASGGIRTGMDVAVALAMGADLVAMARPFLKAAQQGEQAVVDLLEQLIDELRVISFCAGAGDLKQLRQVRTFPAYGQGSFGV